MQEITREIINRAKRLVAARDKKTLGIEELMTGLYALTEEGSDEVLTLLKEQASTETLQWPPRIQEGYIALKEQPSPPQDAKIPLSPELRELINKVHAEDNDLRVDILVKHLLLSANPVVVEFHEQNRTKTKKNRGPVSLLNELTERASALREALNAKVIGQENAVEMLTAAYIRTSIMPAPSNPRGVFTFMGPPGVGKTLLARTFADSLGTLEAEEYQVITIDLSTYSGPQAHEQLFGTSTMYKDSKAGILTGAIKEQPRAVVVLDEIEKAHYHTITSLLPILDRARGFDNHLAEEVDFSQVWFVLTTNLGQEFFAESNESGIMDAGDFSDLAFDVLRNARPKAPGRPTESMDAAPTALPAEFVSRLAKGGAVVFRNLEPSEYLRIIQQALNEVIPNPREGGLDFGPMQVDAEVQFLFLLSLLPDVDARKVASRSSRWVLDMIQDSFASCRETLLEVDPDGYKIQVSCGQEVIEFLGTLHSQIETRLLIIDDDDYVPAITRRAAPARPLEIHHITEAGNPGNEAARIRPDLILLDASIGERDDSSRVEHAMEILDALRRDLPETPVYLFSENPENRENLERSVQRILRSGGARGFIPLVRNGELQADDFSARISRTLADHNLAEVFREIQRGRKTLNFRFRWSVDAETRTIKGLTGMPTVQTRIGTADRYGPIGFSGVPNESLANVVGLERAKRRLGDVVDWLNNPRKLAELGVSPPRGFLLSGPPGTGKTLLARAVAGEARLPFLSLSAGELESKWFGESAARIRELFRKARAYAPAIVFIDEIDSIALRRDGARGSETTRSTLNQLLASMDGYTQSLRPVFVLAATNHAEHLDPALRRPGRFDEVIPIDLPNAAARERFFEMKLKSRCLVGDFGPFVQRTVGRSPAELDRIVREATYLAARDEADTINQEHLDQATRLVVFGASKEGMKISPSELEATAWHEVGHAVAFMQLFPDRRIDYLTVVPTESGALGFLAPQGDETRHSLTSRQVYGQIQVALAGQEAERLQYGDEGLTTGAGQDITQATRLATAYVTRWGMDQEFGPVASEVLSSVQNLELREDAVERISTLLSDARRDVGSILAGRKEQMAALVQRLIAEESLEWVDLRDAKLSA